MNEQELEYLKALSGSLADSLERLALMGIKSLPMAGQRARAEALARLLDVPTSARPQQRSGLAPAPPLSQPQHKSQPQHQASAEPQACAASQPPRSAPRPSFSADDDGLPPWSRQRADTRAELLRGSEPGDIQAGFAAIHTEVEACAACPRHESCTNRVRSWAHGPAKLLVLSLYGAPQFRRFEGLLSDGAGDLMVRMLSAINIKVSEIHTAAMLRCTTGRQSADLGGEWRACKPWLTRELQLTRPRFALVLGELAANVLAEELGTNPPAEGRLAHWGDMRWLWIDHPQQMLADESLKPGAWERLKVLGRAMNEVYR